MRVDGKNEGVRQSMSWLHTWISLLFGWLLYAIFLTGTLSFFQNEITVWMKPELHQSLNTAPQQQQLQHALNYLNQNGQNAESWNIRFANDRQPAMMLNVRKAGEGRRRGGEIYLDAYTGEQLQARETRGGGFLYRFHFELYGMDRIWARWIVGFATMFMFVAIISGIITHKKIFKDFFTFRPAKGQRSWLDAHNATAVFALPFHIMITFSGLLLLMYMLMPWAMNSAYSDRQAFFQALNEQNNPQPQTAQNNQTAQGQQQGRANAENQGENRGERGGQGQGENRGERGGQGQGENRGERGGQGQGENRGERGGQGQGENRGERGSRGERQEPVLESVKMVDFVPLLVHAQQQWKDNPISSINITKPNTIEAEIEIRATHGESLVNRNTTPNVKFNAVTGETLPNTEPTKATVPNAIYNLVTWLHMARGVDSVLRWLLFLSGVLGTMMVATGLVLWVVKRAPDVQKLGYKPIGHRFVEVMNVAAIVGLPIACAAYFTANRFIPAQIAERSPIEIKVFFIVWLVSLIHSAIRPHRHAWLEQLALAAAMFFILPILNFATGGRALWSSVYHGQWMIASFDLICLILGMIFIYGYYKLKRHQGLPVKAKKVAKAAPAQEQN